ncbi:MAG: hypothetical protein KAV83_01860, partial [Desulfobacterales bacterium]|nr:hypothetical protein [Desulfobacterales bacterium]
QDEYISGNTLNNFYFLVLRHFSQHILLRHSKRFRNIFPMNNVIASGAKQSLTVRENNEIASLPACGGLLAMTE